MTKLTRTDCTRDNVAVICPNATLLGFGTRKSKRGFWLVYERDNAKGIGRVIGRVICEGKIYIEIAAATESFSSAHIRWIEPNEVREIRPAPPRCVFSFFSRNDWNPADIFAALEYGVSDMRDQIDERREG